MIWNDLEFWDDSKIWDDFGGTNDYEIWKGYIAHIQNARLREPIYKIELLKQDETALKDITKDIINNSGALSIGGNQGTRRSCNFEIINDNNEYNDFISNLNLKSKFKLYQGYHINGKDFFLSQGVFFFNDPNIISQLSDRKIQISGTDKWAGLDGTNGGILETTYTAEAGTKYSSIIRYLLALSIVGDIKDPIIDPQIENLTIPNGITKEAGSTVADIIKELSDSLTCHCYYNTEGHLVVKKVIPDNQKSVIHRFSRDDINYLGATKILKNSEVYNSVLIVADNTISGIPIVYEALNNNLSDKNSIPNVGIKKVKRITENIKGITTLELAKQRANWELQLCSGQARLINISSVGMYHLDSNQCVELQDEYVDSDFERFIIDSINIPIGTENQMTITGYFNSFDD